MARPALWPGTYALTLSSSAERRPQIGTLEQRDVRATGVRAQRVSKPDEGTSRTMILTTGTQNSGPQARECQKTLTRYTRGGAMLQ